MKPSESTLRRIRSALRLAADKSAPRGEARAAAAMARKLMRKYRITEDQVWDEAEASEQRPREQSVSVSINLSRGDDRHMCATRIAMFRYPNMRAFIWSSKITPDAGAMEFLSTENSVTEIADFWKKLEKELDETWRVTQKLARAFPGASCGQSGKPMPTDEYSWLGGVADGFEAQEQLEGYKTRMHKEFRKLEARQAQRQIVAPQRRRRRVVFNPLAVACIPKLKIIEVAREIHDLLRVAIAKGLGDQLMQAIADRAPEPPPKPARRIDKASHDSGFLLGRILAKRWKRKQQK